MDFCCDMMQENAEARCDNHPDPFDCPDNVIYFNQEDNRYGLIIHDGGTSYLAIGYCPWCGTQLPTSDEDT